MRFFLLFLAFCASVSKAKSSYIDDPLCRGLTEHDKVIGTADVILVGSGPGGAGFLHRLLRLKPNLSVIWIEKGQDFKAYNWPEQINDVDAAVLTNVPRKNLKHLSGRAWNTFGGGDSSNSGGANVLLSDMPYVPVDVFALRNHSIIPPTKTSERWTKAFTNTGFEEGPPFPVKLNDTKCISQPSSLRTKDGKDRLLLAENLRYASEFLNVNYAHARVASVIREGNKGRALGVRGVRIDYAQNEYGGCVAWEATMAVVLAGGVFNTFDLLIESGIGPQEYLGVRDVPEDWWTPNEDVGKEVGDEHAIVFLSAEPEAADPFGAQPRLVAADKYGSSYEFWTVGAFTWFSLKNPNTYFLVNKILPRRLLNIFGAIEWYLKGCSFWGIGIFAEPLIQLEAVAKPRNRTESVDRYMQVPFYSNPFSILEDSYRYYNNQLGIIVDDSKITVTDEMCEAITSAMKTMREGGRLQNKADTGVPTRIRRTVLSILTKTGLTRLLKPNAATFWNAEGFTGKGTNKGKRCRTSMLASYYHYYGGNAKVVDDSYQIKGTPGLFVSDASVLKRLTSGPPSTTIMQTGMRVADALVARLRNDS